MVMISADIIYLPGVLLVHIIYIYIAHKINKIAPKELGKMRYFIGPTILGLILGVSSARLYALDYEPGPGLNIPGAFTGEYLIGRGVDPGVAFVLSSLISWNVLFWLLYKIRILKLE